MDIVHKDSGTVKASEVKSGCWSYEIAGLFAAALLMINFGGFAVGLFGGLVIDSINPSFSRPIHYVIPAFNAGIWLAQPFDKIEKKDCK